MPELWAPFATPKPGPVSKSGYPWAGWSGPKRGSVNHSADGDNPQVMLDILAGPRRASWHFTIGLDFIWQHYPLDAHCWHAGDADDDNGVAANIDTIGKEHMGYGTTPLTPYQIRASTRIDQWAAEQMGTEGFARWPAQHFPVWTLCEHNEVSDTPTACPSGRIPWGVILAILNGESDVTKEEVQRLLDALERKVDIITWNHAVEINKLKKADQDITAFLAAVGNGLGARVAALEAAHVVPATPRIPLSALVAEAAERDADEASLDATAPVEGDEGID